MSDSTTFTAVILTTVEEQLAAGDDTLIDPEVVDLTAFEGRAPSPVFRDGRYQVPDDIIGVWMNPRLENGRLVADIRLQPEYEQMVRPEKNESDLRFSFAGIHAGGLARLIAVHAHLNIPPAEEA